jgi:hypothetical protein
LKKATRLIGGLASITVQRVLIGGNFSCHNDRS